jgi:aspartate carbamoyltransferase catalytic subunit
VRAAAQRRARGDRERRHGRGHRHVDIVYSTRLQEERFASPEEAALYRGRFRLNQQIYTRHCDPNTVIMHPLPRDSREPARELDDDLNDNPNLAIFRQTDNGVLVRMALFALVLDVVEQVDRHARDVTWYTGGRFRMSFVCVSPDDVRVLDRSGSSTATSPWSG